MEKLLLIDGHSILNRAYYGVRDFTNSEGLHTNALYGFLNIMFKMLNEEKPDYLAVAFDLSAPTFRHKMFAEYKGTRKPMQPELKQQVPVIKELLTTMNIQILEMEGFEADDILGTLSKRAEKEGVEVTVLSGDRDLLQLATDHIKITIPKTSKGETTYEEYHTKEVVEKYRVTPTEFIDVKALMGDTSDNIPGVPGIGEKGATDIIAKFGSIEEAHNHIDEITAKKQRESLRDNYDLAVMSKTLATINTEVPIDVDIRNCLVDNMFNETSFDFIKRLEFKSMFSKFENVEHSNCDLEEYFEYTNDITVCTDIAQNAIKAENVGLFINSDINTLYGIGLCFEPEKVHYIACDGFVTESFLAGIISDLVSNANLTVFNIKESQKYLCSTEDKYIFDAQIAAYLLNPLKSSYSYYDLAIEHLGINVPSFEEIFPKTKIEKVNEQDIDSVSKWCCYNAYVLYHSRKILTSKLEEANMLDLYNNLELPLVYALYDMEVTGVKVEKDKLAEYSKILSEKIDVIMNEIYEEVGEEFNINSPKQLGVILFEKLALPYGKKTKTGYSTSADVLDKLKVEYPIVAKILEYRQLTKLKSTYADGLVNYISDDGRIHGKFNQTITATGRISSTDPNLQNIPIRMAMGREIRKVFVAKEGCTLVDADYSQIELRILAHLSGDENLISAYREAKDIHQATASKVFNVPIDEVTKEQRSNAKAVNFGIVYGISSFGLSQDLSISRKEAQSYINEYFVSYPKVKEYLDKCVETAKETGYSVTMFGRRRPIPELSSSNFMQRSFGERVAMNSPIQGSAADIMKIAALNVYKSFKANNLKSKIVLQVHDELLVEADNNEIEKVKEILEQEMKSAANLKVNLEIGMETGSNWFEAH
ncbi:MAG: DNA polymerase I [Lachnospiraceae bacterium]|nr:DNA polymerase I [Lachnospiraceae bacterium]